VLDSRPLITQFTAWLEMTSLSVWVRESPSLLAFPGFLIVHAWGMGFMAGGNAAVDLRILGIASKVELPALEKFYPVMWFGFVINAISGVLLLIGYPTKALTNPVFYLKLACIAAGVVLMVWLRRHVVSTDAVTPKGKLIAVLSLLMWVGAIFAGRLLAYTCTYLMAGFTC
jgi:hypothetical protein